MSGLRGDKWIREMAAKGMIEPFEPKQVRFRGYGVPGVTPLTGEKVISFGTSSYGYDLRVADEFRIFVPRGAQIIDPKNFDPMLFLEERGKGKCIIPPNSFALASSVEKFSIPKNVLGVVLGKSTYARCGINVNCTPMEPGWRGYLTIEIANTTPIPAKVYANEGLCQVLFFESPDECETSYADRDGKYQDQPAQPVAAKA